MYLVAVPGLEGDEKLTRAGVAWFRRKAQGLFVLLWRLKYCRLKVAIFTNGYGRQQLQGARQPSFRQLHFCVNNDPVEKGCLLNAATNDFVYISEECCCRGFKFNRCRPLSPQIVMLTRSPTSEDQSGSIAE